MKEQLTARAPRLRDARHVDGTRVEEGEPKKDEKRLETRLVNVYKATLERIRTGCCQQNCLRKLNTTRLLVQALCHQAEPYEDRATEVSRTTKEALVTGPQGQKTSHYRVQCTQVCSAAFATSRGISTSTLARRRRGVQDSDFVESRTHASKGVLRPSGDRQASAHWMRRFFGDFAQPFPYKTTRSHQTGEMRTLQFLPTHLFSTLNSVYNKYVEDCDDANKSTVSFNTFRRAWLSAHFEVSASQCSVCTVVF